MHQTLLLTLLGVLSFQDPGSGDARALVEMLRSDSIEEREKALKSLKQMGKAAKAALEEAAKDPDGEVTRAVDFLLHRIRMMEICTPRLRKFFPGLEDRLAEGGDRACTELFFQVTTSESRQWLAPLTRSDINLLAGPALRGATSEGETKRLCEVIQKDRLVGAALELRALLKAGSPCAGPIACALSVLGTPIPVEEIDALLKNPDEEIRRHAVPLLEADESAEARRRLGELLTDSALGVRIEAVCALHRLGDTGALFDQLCGPSRSEQWAAIDYVEKAGIRDAIPLLLKLLDDPSARASRRPALVALTRFRTAEALPRAVALLGEPEFDIRTAATQLLGEVGSGSNARRLAPLLAHPYPPTRAAAIEAAVRLDARNLIPEVRDLLNDNDAILRIAAVDALGALRAHEATADILPLLRDRSISVQAAAVHALAALGVREAVPAIAGMLRDDSGSMPVLEALRELEARDQARAIADRLRDQDPWVRKSILRVLGYLRCREYAPAVARLLKDDDIKVRERAIWTLGELKVEDPFEEIEKFLSDEQLFFPAFMTLTAINPRRAAPLLRRCLKYVDPRIRDRAVLELIKQGDPEALQVLDTLAEGAYWQAVTARDAIPFLEPKDRDRVIRKLLSGPAVRNLLGSWPWSISDPETQVILGRLLESKEAETQAGVIGPCLWTGRKDFEDRVRSLIEDPSTVVRGAALWALAVRGHEEIAPQARERLFDLDPSVRQRAIWAVRDLRLVEAIPDLEELLSDDEPFVVEDALRALATLGSRGSIPRLRTLIRKPKPKFLELMLHVLGRFGGREAIPDIAARLQDTRVHVRAAAASALATLGPEEYAPQIRTLLRDKEAGIRATAMDSLFELLGARALPDIMPRLEDPDFWRRDQAADLLARMGSSAGVSRLIRRNEYLPWVGLTSLNGVRQPEIYTRLRGLKFQERKTAPRREILAFLLNRAGMTLDDSAVRGEAWTRHMAGIGVIEPEPGHDTVLFWLPGTLYNSYDFILEPDRIRILPFDEAQAYWKAWWAEQQKPKR